MKIQRGAPVSGASESTRRSCGKGAHPDQHDHDRTDAADQRRRAPPPAMRAMTPARNSPRRPGRSGKHRVDRHHPAEHVVGSAQSAPATGRNDDADPRRRRHRLQGARKRHRDRGGRAQTGEALPPRMLPPPRNMILLPALPVDWRDARATIAAVNAPHRRC